MTGVQTAMLAGRRGDRGIGGVGGAVAAARIALRAAPAATVGCALARCLVGGAPVATAWLTKLVLDELARPGTTGAGLTWLAAGLAATGIAIVAGTQTMRYLATELERRVGLLVTDRLYAVVDRFTGLARFEEPAFLDQLRLAQQAGGQTPAQVVNGACALAQSVITGVGLLGSLVVLSPVMATAVVLAAVPALLAQLAISKRRAQTIWRVGPVERREMFYASLLTSVPAARELRLFGAGAFIRRRMMAERLTANAARRTVDRRELWLQLVLALLGASVAGAGLVWAVGRAATGAASLGDVSLFVAALAGVQASLTGMVHEAALLHQQLLLFEHFRAVERAGADLPVATAPLPVPPLRDGIELRGVWFRYSEDHPWVLCGTDLFIPAGRTTALVGLNGSGKSTVVKLLARLYDPTRGAIYWDGVDIRRFQVADLRRRISAVFQDYMCYDLTAAENIALDEPGPNRMPIIAAARAAEVDGALAALPRGYDTLLSRTFFGAGDDDDPCTGVLLSGGQWQRLALARAVLRSGRDILILDEPSSGLDAAAEQEIHERLAEHSSGGTAVLISHRLGTVRAADRITVLAGGRVVELGDHDSLLAADGMYADLFRRQARGYTASGERR
jgi:ATP-binding cassette, subfamily B, bacterial